MFSTPLLYWTDATGPVKKTKKISEIILCTYLVVLGIAFKKIRYHKVGWLVGGEKDLVPVSSVQTELLNNNVLGDI